jgi:mRNA interferase MazF
MKRGEVWTLSGGSGYASKPRPVLIVQSDRMTESDSVLVCLITSYDGPGLSARLPFSPTVENGLRGESILMADKIMAIAKTKLGKRLGAVTSEEMERVEEAMMLVLGFVG